MKRPLTIFFVCALMLLLGACGGGGSSSTSSEASDEDQIREAVDQYTGLAANDDEGCQDYVASTGPIRHGIEEEAKLKRLGTTSGTPCGLLVAPSELASLVIVRVTISGDTSTVAFDGQTTTAHVVREGDTWLVENIE